MSTIYVPGQTYHFLGINGVYSHVGFVQQETAVSFLAAHAGVQTDYAGPAMDADVQFLGETGMMSLALSRYNEPVVNLLKARINNGAAGSGGAGSIGSLLVGEGLYFSWAALCGYRNKPVFQQAQMNAGYFFPQCYPVNEIGFGMSTQTMIKRITLRTIAKFTPNGDWQSYQIGIPSSVSLPAVN